MLLNRSGLSFFLSAVTTPMLVRSSLMGIHHTQPSGMVTTS